MRTAWDEFFRIFTSLDRAQGSILLSSNRLHQL
jgi:hypothetical protein